jgi:transcriptional regulator with XRE-family HTH domain
MDVQLKRELIRDERDRRAWTQEHLAKLTGLGVRTIQRIEATGVASPESASAISSVFSIPLADLRVSDIKASDSADSGASWLSSIRSLAKSRWVIGTEMLLCFGPLTVACFLIIQGSLFPRDIYQPSVFTLLFLIGAATGPIGLFVGMRVVLFRATQWSRHAVVFLGLAAAWMAGWSLIVLNGEAPLSAWGPEAFTMILLPLVGVLHLAILAFRPDRSLQAS